MAKKTVARLKTGEAKGMTKVIKVVKSPKTGAYSFKSEIVSKDAVDAYIKGE